jgi:hypothetical protein
MTVMLRVLTDGEESSPMYNFEKENYAKRKVPPGVIMKFKYGKEGCKLVLSWIN